MQDLETYYDETPYVSTPIMSSRPESIRAVASMHGLPAADLETARILELGCASGGNLIPVATRFPNAQCIGLDLSGKQIDAGRKLVEACGGLSNLELRQGSISDIDTSWGKFDYILCHGVFSWVPGEVREAILRVCKENLADTGVAQVSFNAYPGWKSREIVRDAMIFAAQDGGSAHDRLVKARAMIEIVSKHADKDSIVSKSIDDARKALTENNDAYVIHEFLEPFNQPFYLQEFVRQIRGSGLEYLGDSELPTMFMDNYPESMRKAVDDYQPKLAVEAQQFLDYLVNRTFRSSLIAHPEQIAKLNGRLGPMTGRHFDATFTNEFDAQGNIVPNRLKDRNGMVYESSHPVFMIIAELLTRAYPATVSYADLKHAVFARTQAAMSDIDQAVEHFLRMMVIRGTANSFDAPGKVARKVSDRPLVKFFEREHIRQQFKQQPESGRFTAWSLGHQELLLDPFGAWLATQLDGTRDVTALAIAAEKALADGLPILPPEAGNVTREVLMRNIPLALESLRQFGLLEREE